MNPVPASVSLRFTDRQLEVAGLIARGHTNDEIGELIGVTGRTVKAHVENTRRKLDGVHRRFIPTVILDRASINVFPAGR